MPTLPAFISSWLWPFMLLGMVLVALLVASLAWASGTPDRAPPDPGAGFDASTPAQPGGQRSIWLAALLVPVLVMSLYAALGNPRAINPLERNPTSTEAVETMLGRLIERLQAQPDDPAGWLMLARSYRTLGQYAESAQAWEKARALAWDDVDNMAEWVETRILASDQHFDRRSQELLARAMDLNPEHPGVLLLRGLAALDRGDTETAQKVLSALRDQYPEASPDRDALDQALLHITAMQKLGRNAAAASAASAPDAPLAPPDAPPQNAEPPTSAATP